MSFLTKQHSVVIVCLHFEMKRVSIKNLEKLLLICIRILEMSNFHGFAEEGQ